MVFENMETWGMAWGYIFVIVIAGASLFVGLKKKQIIAKRKLDEKLAKPESPSETKPDLEQVEEKKTDVKTTDDKDKELT